MGFIENVITPAFILIFYLVIGGWVCYMGYYFFKEIKYPVKYKIFRRPFNEEDVAWCGNAISNNMDYWDVKKFLLLKGKSKKRVNEMLYIFDRVTDKLKGGKTK